MTHVHIKRYLILAIITATLVVVVPATAAGSDEVSGATEISIADADDLAKIGTDPGYPIDGHYIQTSDIDLIGTDLNAGVDVKITLISAGPGTVFGIQYYDGTGFVDVPDSSVYAALWNNTARSSVTSGTVTINGLDAGSASVLYVFGEIAGNRVAIAFDIPAGAPIDFSATKSSNGNFEPIGTVSVPFTGTYDGNNKSIKNLETSGYSASGNVYVGIFAFAGETVIKDLKLECGSSVAIGAGASSVASAGKLIGNKISSPNKAEITNVSNSGSVYSWSQAFARSGGIAGMFEGADMSNVRNYGTITATNTAPSIGNPHWHARAGGLAGYGIYGIISNCSNAGSIIVPYSGDNVFIGGISGYNMAVSFFDDTNSGTLDGTAYNEVCAGGMSGFSKVREDSVGNPYSAYEVDRCYNTGSVRGAVLSTSIFGSYIGGLFGALEGWPDRSGTPLTIVHAKHLYNYGTVTAVPQHHGYVGGVVGYSFVADVSDSVNEGSLIVESTSEAIVGGIVGVGDGRTHITNSINKGPILIISQEGSYVGGILGVGYDGFYNLKDISVIDSENRGNIVLSGVDYVSAGGIIGMSQIPAYYTNVAITGSQNNGSIISSGGSIYSIVGGIIGEYYTGALTITDSANHAALNVTADGLVLVGGAVGYEENGTVGIGNTYNGGRINVVSSGGLATAGGLAGLLESPNAVNISNSYNLGNVDLTNNAINKLGVAGGIAGLLAAPSVITASYNAGDVQVGGTGTQPRLAGGIAGYTEVSLSISYSHNVGLVSASGSPDSFDAYAIGGIFGGVATVDDFYALEGTAASDEFLGLQDSGSFVLSNSYTLTETETVSASSYSGWLFGPNQWGIYEGYGYPYISSIENNVFVVPSGGAKSYDAQPAPVPGYTVQGNYDPARPLTGALAYAGGAPVDIGTYLIVPGTLDLRSPYYQTTFRNGVPYQILSNVLTITATADGNTNLSPTGSVAVAFGNSASFVFSAKSGYVLSDVIIDGLSRPDLVGAGSYTFTDVRSNHTLRVISVPVPDTVLITAEIIGGEGYIEYHIGQSPYVRFEGSIRVHIGSDVYLRAVAGSGYEFVEWTGDVASGNVEVRITGADRDTHLEAHLKASSEGSGTWSILNLIAAVLAIASAIIAIIAGRGRTDDGERRSRTALLLRIAGLIVGIITIVLFFLTEDMSLPIGTYDEWTLPTVALLIVALVLSWVSFRFDREQ